MPNLFHYDFTLDQGGVAKSESSNSQELENKLARESCEALARLAGLREGWPANDAVQASLSALLTPYIVRLLPDSPLDYVLKLLNSNTRNPVFVWDNGTRQQMLGFVEEHRGATAAESEEMGAEFRFQAYEKELIIGDVFVRLYNEQPSFAFEVPKAFCVELLDFLGKEAQYLHSLISMETDGTETEGGKKRLSDVAAAIQALTSHLKRTPAWSSSASATSTSSSPTCAWRPSLSFNSPHLRYTTFVFSSNSSTLRSFSETFCRFIIA